jgi:membrane protease YdiL (CAAX protease family)
MLSYLKERAVYKDWRIALLIFVFVATIQFTAAFLHSLSIQFVGMAFYALLPLVLVRKAEWREMRIRKPENRVYILLGIGLIALMAVCEYFEKDLTLGMSSLNYTYLMAKQAMAPGVINARNAWQYYPIAVIGGITISPFTEEFFYRGLLLRSFENRVTPTVANIFQSLLFSVIHLAYFWMIEFNWKLILFVPSMMLGGFIFGWFVQKTNSLSTSIILHMVFNFITFTFVYFLMIPAIG